MGQAKRRREPAPELAQALTLVGRHRRHVGRLLHCGVDAVLAALHPAASSGREGQVKPDRSGEPLEPHRSEGLEAGPDGLGSNFERRCSMPTSAAHAWGRTSQGARGGLLMP